MSTRCMVLVAQHYDSKDKAIPLYRHSDGYLAETGASLVEAVRGNPPDCEAVLAKLLAERYEYDGVDSGPVYRAATWTPEKQGDLEHVYALDYLTDGGVRCGPRTAAASWRITHYARPSFSESTSEDYREWPHAALTPAEFAATVNRERKATNNRLKARNMSLDPYPILDMEGL